MWYGRSFRLGNSQFAPAATTNVARRGKATHFLVIFIAPGCYESIKKRGRSHIRQKASECSIFSFCHRRCNVCALPLAPNIAAAVAVVLLLRWSRDMQIDSQPRLLMENTRDARRSEISIMQPEECYECCGRSFLKSNASPAHTGFASKKISDSSS
jgi:hypothetical protein